MVVEEGVEDVMSLLGFRSDVAALLSILDVQLNVSYGTEATSMALLEGMSLGLPSIVSDYGGNPWLVKDGDNGLIFPSRDSRALAACIARLMDRPEEPGMHGRAGPGRCSGSGSPERSLQKMWSKFTLTS